MNTISNVIILYNAAELCLELARTYTHMINHKTYKRTCARRLFKSTRNGILFCIHLPSSYICSRWNCAYRPTTHSTIAAVKSSPQLYPKKELFHRWLVRVSIHFHQSLLDGRVRKSHAGSQLCQRFCFVVIVACQNN